MNEEHFRTNLTHPELTLKIEGGEYIFYSYMEN